MFDILERFIYLIDILDAERDDSGNYKLTVSNPSGEASQNFKIGVVSEYKYSYCVLYINKTVVASIK